MAAYSNSQRPWNAFRIIGLLWGDSTDQRWIHSFCWWIDTPWRSYESLLCVCTRCCYVATIVNGCNIQSSEWYTYTNRQSRIFVMFINMAILFLLIRSGIWGRIILGLLYKRFVNIRIIQCFVPSEKISNENRLLCELLPQCVRRDGRVAYSIIFFNLVFKWTILSICHEGAGILNLQFCWLKYYQ